MEGQKGNEIIYRRKREAQKTLTQTPDLAGDSRKLSAPSVYEGGGI